MLNFVHLNFPCFSGILKLQKRGVHGVPNFRRLLLDGRSISSASTRNMSLLKCIIFSSVKQNPRDLIYLTKVQYYCMILTILVNFDYLLHWRTPFRPRMNGSFSNFSAYDLYFRYFIFFNSGRTLIYVSINGWLLLVQYSIKFFRVWFTFIY